MKDSLFLGLISRKEGGNGSLQYLGGGHDTSVLCLCRDLFVELTLCVICSRPCLAVS